MRSDPRAVARGRFLRAAQAQVDLIPAVARGGHALEHLDPGPAFRHGPQQLLPRLGPLPGGPRGGGGHAGVVLHGEPQAQERLLLGAARREHLREQEVSAPVAARALERALEPWDGALAAAAQQATAPSNGKYGSAGWRRIAARSSSRKRGQPAPLAAPASLCARSDRRSLSTSRQPKRTISETSTSAETAAQPAACHGRHRSGPGSPAGASSRGRSP